MPEQRSVERQFGAVADKYATSAVHIGGADLTAMLAAISPHGDERLLDAGTGTGHTALAFAPRVREVVAVDLTEPMLEQGRRLAAEQGVGNIVFERGDVEQLRYLDASFEIVTSRYSAHHFPHPLAALRELSRVLKPGGELLLVDTVSPDDPTTDTFLNAIELLRDRSHVRDHSVAEWQAMFALAGLSSDDLGRSPLRLEFTAWVTRMATPQPAVDQIQNLFETAPVAVLDNLLVEDDATFTVPVALLRGRHPSVTSGS